MTDKLTSAELEKIFEDAMNFQAGELTEEAAVREFYFSIMVDFFVRLRDNFELQMEFEKRLHKALDQIEERFKD